jgi:hypothetical protein
MISTRFEGLVIDTVVCLTLAKWETVSGQFGGYLTSFSAVSQSADTITVTLQTWHRKMCCPFLCPSEGMVRSRCISLLQTGQRRSRTRI